MDLITKDCCGVVVIKIDVQFHTSPGPLHALHYLACSCKVLLQAILIRWLCWADLKGLTQRLFRVTLAQGRCFTGTLDNQRNCHKLPKLGFVFNPVLPYPNAIAPSMFLRDTAHFSPLNQNSARVLLFRRMSAPLGCSRLLAVTAACSHGGRNGIMS